MNAELRLCLLCQCSNASAIFLRNPYLHGDALTLARKINPDWQPSDGCCIRRFDSIVDTVAQIQDAKAQERPSTMSIRECYRYTLTKREQGQWQHCNPDMQRWRQNQIVECVSDSAYKAGYDGWLLFDVDEVMLAQGVASGRVTSG